MSLSNRKLNGLFEEYKKHPQLKVKEGISYQPVFDEAFEYIQKEFAGYLDLSAIDLDPTRYSTEIEHIFKILYASLHYGAKGKLIFDRVSAKAACLEVGKSIYRTDLQLSQHGQTSHLGLREKYLQDSLGIEEWLTELDVRRFLSETGMTDKIHITRFNSIDIGMVLHFEREKRPADSNESYTISFMLNKGRDGIGEGIRWAAASVTVDPANNKISYQVHDGSYLSEDEKQEIFKIMEDAIKYKKTGTHQEVDSDQDKEKGKTKKKGKAKDKDKESAPTSVKKEYRAYDDFVIFNNECKVTASETHKDKYLCGYRALHKLYQSDALKSSIKTNPKAKEFSECQADGQLLAESIYRNQLGTLKVTNEQLGLFVSNKKAFAPLVGEAMQEVRPEAVSQFISYMKAGEVPLKDTESSVNPIVNNNLNEFSIFLDSIAFTTLNTDKLSALDYEQYLLKLHKKLDENKKTLNRLTISPLTLAGLDGVNVFVANTNKLKVENITLELDIDASDVEKFIVKFKSLLLHLSDKELKSLSIVDKKNVLNKEQWEALAKFIKNRRVSVDVVLPSKFMTDKLQRDIDHAISDNKRAKAIDSFGKTSSAAIEIIPDNEKKEKRRRPHIDVTQNLDVDIELQQEQQVEIAIEVQKISHEKTNDEIGDLDVIAFNRSNEFIDRLNRKAFSMPSSSYLLSNADARKIWDSWFGHIGSVEDPSQGIGDFSNLLTGITAQACEQLLKYANQGPGGLNYNHLPLGFSIVEYPPGVGKVLHYDKNNFFHLKTNPLAVQFNDALKSEPLAYSVVKTCIQILEEDKNSEHNKLIVTQWKNIQKGEYDSEFEKLFRAYLPKMMSCFDYPTLKTVFDLASDKGKNKLSKEKFVFLMENLSQVHYLFPNGFDKDVKPASTVLMDLFPNEYSEVVKFANTYHEIKSAFVNTSPHVLLKLLRHNEQLKNKVMSLVTKKPASANLDALLQVYNKYGEKGLTQLFSLWDKTNPDVLESLHTSLFSKMSTYVPLLDTRYQNAIEAIQSFDGNKKEWWEALLKKHGEVVGYDDLPALVDAFKEFSNKIEEKKLSFYKLSPQSFKEAKSLPITLSGILSVLDNCQKEDLKEQWESVTELSLQSSETIRAISYSKSSPHQCRFVVPEMEINEANYNPYYGYGSRALVSKEKWRDITSSVLDPISRVGGNLVVDKSGEEAAKLMVPGLHKEIFRYLAHESHKASISFYRKALAMLDDPKINHSCFSLQTKTALAALLVCTTVGYVNSGQLGSEEKLLEDWKKLLEIIANPPLNDLVMSALNLFLSKVGDIDMYFNIVNLVSGIPTLPSLPVSSRLAILMITTAINAADEVLTVPNVAKLLTDKGRRKVGKQLETKMQPLTQSYERLIKITKKFDDAIYQGMKYYQDSDYAGLVPIFYSHLDVADLIFEYFNTDRLSIAIYQKYIAATEQVLNKSKKSKKSKNKTAKTPEFSPEQIAALKAYIHTDRKEIGVKEMGVRQTLQNCSALACLSIDQIKLIQSVVPEESEIFDAAKELVAKPRDEAHLRIIFNSNSTRESPFFNKTKESLLRLISTFKIKTSDVNEIMAICSNVAPIDLEPLNYALSLLTKMENNHGLDANIFKSFLKELEPILKSNAAIEEKNNQIEALIEKKFPTNYSNDYFVQLRAKGMSPQAENYIDNLSSNKDYDDEDINIIKGVIGRFLKSGEGLQHEDLAKKIRVLCDSIPKSDRKHFLKQISQDRFFKYHDDSTVNIGTFITLIDTLTSSGRMNDFIYFVTQLVASDADALAEKAILYIETILPAIEKFKSESVSKMDSLVLVNHLLLLGSRNSLQEEPKVVLGDEITIVNGVLIKQFRNFQVHQDDKENKRKEPFDRKTLEQIKQSLDGLKEKIPETSSLASFGQLLTYLNDLLQPNQTTTSAVEKQLEVERMQNTFKSEASKRLKSVKEKISKYFNFKKTSLENEKQADAGSATKKEDKTQKKEKKQKKKKKEKKQSNSSSTEAALKQTVEKQKLVGRQLEVVYKDLQSLAQNRRKYPGIFNILFRNLYHIAEQHPIAKKALFSLFDTYIDGLDKQSEKVMVDAWDFVSTIQTEFSRINDSNIILSLCHHYNKKEGDLTPASLIQLFNDPKFRRLKEGKSTILNLISSLLNNDKDFTSRELDRLIQLCSAPVIGEILLGKLGDFFAKPPFPSIQQILSWHDATIMTLDYKTTLEDKHKQFDIHPADREEENGFILESAKNRIKEFKGIDISDAELEHLAGETKRLRGLSTQELLDELKQFKQEAQAELGGPVDNEKLLALTAELLYRGKAREGGPGSSFEINTTQYLAILAMLKTGAHVTSKIGTGEGKTRIMMIANACQFALGKTVDFVTSDVQLATRDYLEFQTYFKMLGAETNLIYADTAFNGYRLNGINFSDGSNLSLFRNKARSTGNASQVIIDNPSLRALTLDEADKTFFDLADTRFNYSTQGDESIKGMEWIYPVLMEFFAQDDINKNKDIENLYYDDIDECNTKFFQFAAAKCSPEQLLRLKALSQAQIESWQESAMIARSLKFKKDFVIQDDITIFTPYGPKQVSEAKLLAGDRVSKHSKFSFGVHQCLHVRLNMLRKNPDNSLLSDELKKCKYGFHVEPEKQIIYSSSSKCLVDDYNQGTLLAVTGTPGPIILKEEARKLYGHRPSATPMNFISVPRHRGLQRKDRAVRLTANRSQQIKALVQYIIEARAKNKPVLVICENDAESELMDRELRRALNNLKDKGSLDLNKHMQRIHSQLSYEEENSAIKKAGQAGIITVSTGMIGRGTDIKLAPEASKGLRVLLTYLPQNRDMKQIFGRSGRFGAKGDTRLVLDKAELKKRLGEAHLKEMYTGVVTYLKRKQALMDRKKQFERLIKLAISDFNRNITDNFFEDFCKKIPVDQRQKVIPLWIKFFYQKDIAWKTAKQAIDNELKETDPSVDNINLQLSKYQADVQKIWNKDLYSKIAFAEIGTIDDPKKHPVEFLSKEIAELKLNDQMKAMITGFNLKEVVPHKVKIYDKYDPAHDGFAVVYNRPFVKFMATLRGERKLFADFRAWRGGHGILFPNFRAWRKGELTFGEFFLNVGKQTPKEVGTTKPKQMSSTSKTQSVLANPPSQQPAGKQTPETPSPATDQQPTPVNNPLPSQQPAGKQTPETPSPATDQQQPKKEKRHRPRTTHHHHKKHQGRLFNETKKPDDEGKEKQPSLPSLSRSNSNK